MSIIIETVKTLLIGLIAIIGIYITARVISYAFAMSWHQVKLRFGLLPKPTIIINNSTKEVSENGEKEKEQDQKEQDQG